MGGPPSPYSSPTPQSEKFIQLDGNISVDSSYSENEDFLNPIHIQMGYRPKKATFERPPSQEK